MEDYGGKDLLCGEPFQCLCAIFYKFLTTQFYFYESVAAITQMNNGIALQSVFVAFYYGKWRFFITSVGDKNKRCLPIADVGRHRID